MNKALHITATFDKPGFLKDLVEKLAQRHREYKDPAIRLPKGFRNLNVSSTEAFASGDVKLAYHKKRQPNHSINIPFTTSFLFTCRKSRNGSCKVVWSNSLS